MTTTRQRAQAPIEQDIIQNNNRATDRWHIGKEIPVVLICAVIMQTAGGIWWMSQLSTKLDNAIATIAEFKLQRYTTEDARRDRELLDQKFGAGTSRDAELERRINGLESRVDRVERK